MRNVTRKTCGWNLEGVVLAIANVVVTSGWRNENGDVKLDPASCRHHGQR
jgi:hypothetical protein